MKRKGLFFFLMITIMWFTAPAQQFGGGLKIGIMGTQVDGDGYGGFHKAGITGGAFVNIRATQHSAFQMELAYVQKGSRKNPNYEKEDFEEYILRTDYIELPILYQFVYSDKLSFEAGPCLGYLLNTHELKYGLTVTPVPFRKTIVNYIGGIYFNLNERTTVNLRMNNSILSLRNKDRLPGDTYRFWHYGQFHVALGLTLQYNFKPSAPMFPGGGN